MIYLDNAATTLRKPSVVYKTYFDAVRKCSANAGRGGHRYALRASEMVFEAAESVATLLGILQPERIAFTQNATMALNMAIHGAVRSGGHIVLTQTEHNSVLRPVVYSGCDYTVAKADENGYVSPQAISQVMRENTQLVIVNHISNVCGQVQPVEEIARIAHEYGALLLVDAAQSAGIAHIDAVGQGIDLLAFAGHKGLMGPLGTGGLYVAPAVRIAPLLQGGSGSESENPMQPSAMPDLLVSGTVNAPAIAALGSAARYVQSLGKGALLAHEKSLAKAFCDELYEMKGVHAYCGNGDGSGVVSINIENKNPVEVGDALERDHGIAVRSGLHCAPLMHQALLTYPAGTVRFSFGHFNTMRDVKKAADAVYKCIKSV